MKSIIVLFWDICRLRASPALVPGEAVFAALVLAANVGVSVVVSLVFQEEPDVPGLLGGVVVGLAVNSALVWVLLGARNLKSRFTTTIAALYGCDLLMTLVFGVILAIATPLGPAITGLAFTGYLVWSLSVVGFILHRALGIAFSIGIGLALGMSLLSVAAGELAMGA